MAKLQNALSKPWIRCILKYVDMETIKVLINKRALTVELVCRELKLRYRGTWLGFLWSMLNPLVFMAVYTLVFSQFLRVEIPKFPAFVLTGLLAWNWFSESVIMGTNCLVDHAPFLRNAIFPAQILPIVSVSVAMMNYVFALPLLFVLLIVYKAPMGWPLLALPLVMVVQFLLSLGIVFLTATFNVFLRDLWYIVRHGLTMVFFLTPVMYDLSFVPTRFQWVLKINPMTIVIDSYRRSLFYGLWPRWPHLALVLVLALILFAIGIFVFEHNKETFAEHL
ncbi:MAG: ABC transporter permease [Candidatus Bipolaricaulaceae bacterium]